ncbi:unnamed protein product, partial [Ectocarpus sp. 4 AP-2014]
GDAGRDAAGPALKKPKPPPSFSMATFSGGLDGSEGRGIPSAEFVGSCFRKGRKDGLLLYYVEKAPRDYPFEVESKAAGAASLDWSVMRKHLKVDAFCMETFRWYGAKVAEVSEERKQVKVHFNGWKSKFDEWMDWESFRLAPCGSRSSAKREGESASTAAKKESLTRCVLVPARRTVRIRINCVDDWCIDYSDTNHPVLWIISGHAWYKVAGSGWWDFVAPHPIYAPVFEPSRKSFALTCLVARALQSSPTSTLAAVGRRVSQITSGVLETRDIVEEHEVVAATIAGMGALSTKKKPDNAESMLDGGGEDGSWPGANGDNNGSSDSVDAKDTLFLKELATKGQEWEANGRSFVRRPPPPPIPSPAITRPPPDRRMLTAPDRGPFSKPAPNTSATAAAFSSKPAANAGPIRIAANLNATGGGIRTGGGGGGGVLSGSYKAEGSGTPKLIGGPKPGGPKPGGPKPGGGFLSQGGGAGTGGGGALPRPGPAVKGVKTGPTAEERLQQRIAEKLEKQAKAEKLAKEKAAKAEMLAREKAEKAEIAAREKAEKAEAAAREKAEKAARERAEKEAERERKALEKKQKLERQAEEKARLLLERQAERQAAHVKKLEKQREMAEEKERARRAKEAERLAKLEQKRLEKEAKDRERAEQQAREQARRGIEKERAKLAKRYPLPDEELRQEQLLMGKQPAPWPEPGKLPCPRGFPPSAFGDVVSAWACLQLFGTLMHLKRFSLDELMVGLANGAPTVETRDGGPPADAAEDLLDIIPAPVGSDPNEDAGGAGGYGEGVLRRVETRRMAAARGFAGLGFRRKGARGRDARVLQARVLDPLGEVMRILRHLLKSEEAKPFADVPSDDDVAPELESGLGDDGGFSGEGEGGGVKKEEEKAEVKRPLDLGTILRRAENGWYDLEPGAEPPVESNSFGAGHAGVAYDVELMQQGWLEAKGADSAIFEQARGVVDEFLALYETHVLNPLVELDKDIRGSAAAAAAGRGGLEEGRVLLRSDTDSEGARRAAAGCSDPLEMVRQMGSEEYRRWSPAARSRALAWLCDEALSAATMNDLVKKVQEAKEVVDRKDREIKAAVRQRLRDQEATEARGFHNPHNRRSTEAEMITARMLMESPDVKTVRELGSVKVRLKPLGLDRDRRRYWLFATGEDHRLFVEHKEVWGCYYRVSQLKALHKWLDRRGVRERTLKASATLAFAALREHLIANLGVSAQELEPVRRPHGGSSRGRSDVDGFGGGGNERADEGDEGEEEDGQQYLGEPAEVAREKERERSAGMLALNSCGFAAEEQRRALKRLCSSFAVDLHSLRAAGLAFELKTSGWVMRDLAVHMGPNGLGLQLDVRHGGVVVDGLTKMPPGVSNPGQAAGVRLGDLLVSVDTIVAETPRRLAQGLQDTGLSQSGKLVVVKVLSDVLLTDGQGEPLQQALDYAAIDMVKGALLESESRLHHSFVLGPGWEGQACTEWRLGVSFAGQGADQNRGGGGGDARPMSPPGGRRLLSPAPRSSSSRGRGGGGGGGRGGGERR